MKKLMGMIVLALLLLSIAPLALAEEGSGSESTASTDATTANDASSTTEEQATPPPPPAPGMTAREQRQKRIEAQKDLAKERREQLQERIEAQKKRLKERREQLRERVEDARDRYEQAKERYQDARDRFQEAKKKVERAREKFAGCQNDESTECLRVRQQVQENAQPYLLHSADMVLEALERLHARVEAADEMDPEKQAALLADLDEQISEVESAKAVIQNLDNESTAEEIKDAAKIIREAWQHANRVMKRGVGHVINARLGNIVHQAERLSERIHKTRDNLEARGKDVSALDEKLAEYDEKLQLAKDEWQAAVDLYKDGAPGDVDEIARKAHAHVEKAKEYLRGVRDSLREIVKEIKESSGGNLEVAADASASASASDAESLDDDGTTDQGSGETNGDESPSDDSSSDDDGTADQGSGDANGDESSSDDETSNDDGTGDQSSEEEDPVDLNVSVNVTADLSA